MNELGRRFREHVLSTHIDGCTVLQLDENTIELRTPHAIGAVVFYAFDDMPEIVELRIADVECADEPTFFLHFELEDEDRAQELFAQMVDALSHQDDFDTARVLLCCTAGMTTSLFAGKLAEAAKTLSIDYSFEAIPLEQAKAEGGSWDAVLLAPQVGYMRQAVAEAFPNAVVVEIPAKIFATFNAAAALRMVMHLLSDHTVFPEPDAENLKFMRDLKNDRRIMCVTCIKRPRSTWTGWRIYDHGTVIGSGKSVKPEHDMRDIEDLIATLPAQGFSVSELDAIGIAVPGVVQRGTVAMGGRKSERYDLGHNLYKRYGTKVFVENNARAAAVGCYVSQNDYDSVVLHTQQTGFPVGGQGMVIDGHLSKGRKSFAGEIGPLATTQRRPEYDDGTPWTPEGMYDIVARTLAADISLISPDAIYVAVDLIDDMDALRAKIGAYFYDIEEYVPDLIKVTDYRERVAFGTLALCLQKLHDPRPHRKH